MPRHAAYPDDTDEVDVAYLDSLNLPDGSFVQGFVTVVSYVDPDGTNGWRLHYGCDIPTTQVVGLLACAQVEMMARTPRMITNISPLDDDD